MKKHFHGVYGSPIQLPVAMMRFSMHLFISFNFLGFWTPLELEQHKRICFQGSGYVENFPQIVFKNSYPRDIPRLNQCTQLVCSNSFWYYQQVHLNDLLLCFSRSLKTVQDTSQIWLSRPLVNISNLINLMASDKSL